MMKTMLTRRTLLAACAASCAVCVSPLAAQQPKPQPGEDGLYHFDWYLESFLDLAEDVATARTNGKRLAIIVSQRGCIYCKRMAEEHFSDPKIVAYVRENFEVLHLDLFGAKEITDFDGAKLGEKAFAQKYGVRLTPTILFFPESADGLGRLDVRKREVARMPGLLEPREFLAMFRFVREKAYEASSFNEWLKRQG